VAKKIVSIQIQGPRLALVPIDPDTATDTMRLAAQFTQLAILERTNEGLNLFGAPFNPPYSDGYARWKSNRGRSPGTPGDWLRFTGQLLQDLQLLELAEDAAVLGFPSGRATGDATNEDVARYIEEYHPGRRFFGINDDEADELDEEIASFLSSRMDLAP
jgi:hypothetical protein